MKTLEKESYGSNEQILIEENSDWDSCLHKSYTFSYKQDLYKELEAEKGTKNKEFITLFRDRGMKSCVFIGDFLLPCSFALIFSDFSSLLSEIILVLIFFVNASHFEH